MRAIRGVIPCVLLLSSYPILSAKLHFLPLPLMCTCTPTLTCTTVLLYFSPSIREKGGGWHETESTGAMSSFQPLCVRGGEEGGLATILCTPPYYSSPSSSPISFSCCCGIAAAPLDLIYSMLWLEVLEVSEVVSIELSAVAVCAVSLGRKNFDQTPP